MCPWWSSLVPVARPTARISAPAPALAPVWKRGRSRGGRRGGRGRGGRGQGALNDKATATVLEVSTGLIDDESNIPAPNSSSSPVKRKRGRPPSRNSTNEHSVYQQKVNKEATVGETVAKSTPVAANSSSSSPSPPVKRIRRLAPLHTTSDDSVINQEEGTEATTATERVAETTPSAAPKSASSPSVKRKRGLLTSHHLANDSLNEALASLAAEFSLPEEENQTCPSAEATTAAAAAAAANSSISCSRPTITTSTKQTATDDDSLNQAVASSSSYPPSKNQKNANDTLPVIVDDAANRSSFCSPSTSASFWDSVDIISSQHALCKSLDGDSSDSAIPGQLQRSADEWITGIKYTDYSLAFIRVSPTSSRFKENFELRQQQLANALSSINCYNSVRFENVHSTTTDNYFLFVKKQLESGRDRNLRQSPPRELLSMDSALMNKKTDDGTTSAKEIFHSAFNYINSTSAAADPQSYWFATSLMSAKQDDNNRILRINSLGEGVSDPSYLSRISRVGLRMCPFMDTSDGHFTNRATILLAGHPRIWVIIHPDSLERYLHHVRKIWYWNGCDDKILIVPPALLKRLNIKYNCVLQEPGTIVVTRAFTISYGFDIGPNLSQSYTLVCSDYSDAIGEYKHLSIYDYCYLKNSQEEKDRIQKLKVQRELIRIMLLRGVLEDVLTHGSLEVLSKKLKEWQVLYADIIEEREAQLIQRMCLDYKLNLQKRFLNARRNAFTECTDEFTTQWDNRSRMLRPPYQTHSKLQNRRDNDDGHNSFGDVVDGAVGFNHSTSTNNRGGDIPLQQNVPPAKSTIAPVTTTAASVFAPPPQASTSSSTHSMNESVVVSSSNTAAAQKLTLPSPQPPPNLPVCGSAAKPDKCVTDEGPNETLTNSVNRHKMEISDSSSSSKPLAPAAEDNCNEINTLPVRNHAAASAAASTTLTNAASNARLTVTGKHEGRYYRDVRRYGTGMDSDSSSEEDGDVDFGSSDED